MMKYFNIKDIDLKAPSWNNESEKTFFDMKGNMTIYTARNPRELA